MAITQTTVSAAVGKNDLFISVTSATGFAAGNWLKIDNEFMIVSPAYGIAPYTSTVIPVLRRGDQGSAVIAHNALAIAVTGLFTDFANGGFGSFDYQSPQRWADDSVTYSVSGAITIPTRKTTIVLDKAGVAAMTLAAPGKDQDGLELFITSVTAQAHTVTATGLLSTGTASVNVATFAAQKGSGVVLVAQQGLWNVKSSPGITFS